MPANYTGDPAGEVDELPVVPCPVDGDPRNAASLNAGLQKLADVVAYLIDRTHPEVLTAGQARVLISEIDDNRGTGTPKTRVYLNADGEIEIARNCHWEPLDSEWLADIWYPSRRFSSSLTILQIDGFQVRTYGSIVANTTTNGWDDGDWTIQTALVPNGYLRFLDVIDPAPTDAKANTIEAKNTPKAWASIVIASGTASIENGFNVASVAQAAGTLTVNFPTLGAMGDDLYAVVATPVGGLLTTPWNVSARRTSGFDLICPATDISTGTHRVSIVVFGAQST